MLGITICATEKFAYALRIQAQAVLNAVCHARQKTYLANKISVILATNNEKLALEMESLYKRLIPNECNFYGLILPVDDTAKTHKVKAQKNIALLRTAAFNKAKSLGCDYVWSLDSDVLPKHNALSASFDVINFDGGYYKAVSCPYPSQGGGGFLCGRGTFTESILRDVYDDEKDIDPRINKRIKKYEIEIASIHKKLKKAKRDEGNDKLFKRAGILSGKIGAWKRYIRNRVGSKNLNVFKLNSKKWRKRGWFDFAYPAIGKGSIVPTDWTGFGCLLISKEALNMIDFHGYEGHGTEDLFITWQRWYLNDIKIAALPHCPADHVIRARGEKDKKIHIFTFHEPEGEFEGHLRQDHREFNEYL